MGTSLKSIEVDDLICVTSAPQSLQDQNCLSVFYKEYTDSKKKKFKISEFKMVCARSLSKLSMIEKLRLNIKNKFTFDHLKLNNEIAAEDYFKGMVNKPQQIYQAIKIIHYVYFYKNAIHFLSIFKKKHGKEKSLLNVEVDKLLSDKQPDIIVSGKSNDSDHVLKFAKNQLEEFRNAKTNLNNNLNKGINDSNLFVNEKIEKDSLNSRIKIYEKKESREGFDDILAHNQINFNIDTEKNKESENDLKKFILQNHNNLNENTDNISNAYLNHLRNSKLNNPDNSKEMISYVNIFKLKIKNNTLKIIKLQNDV